MSEALRTFSEREFYLGEFRGRTLAIAWPATETVTEQPLAGVVAELSANGSRVVVLSPVEEVFVLAGVGAPVDASAPSYAPALWRDLRERGAAGLRVGAEDFASACVEIARTLRLAKLVWIRSTPPVERIEGAGGDGEGRVSVVDLAHLAPLLDAEADPAGEVPLHRAGADSQELLVAIRALIESGVPSVNVCAAGDLARELFTYNGAGIFFTRNRYAEVRPLAIDDYDLANDLIERGEADGFLAPRDAAARDAVLAHGVGVFIEGRYLAGIGAILPYPEDRAVELASLFALTRYVGEGAGGQIVRYAIERARDQGLAYLFSCTTSERVEGFFARHGFRRVDVDALPEAKWKAYDPARPARVRCLRFDLD
jgi:N-acetylglutamate synthase-like GNAT family acetyltransferase